MDADATKHSRMSPLAAGAAIAVMIFSMVGVAAMTGLLPSASSTKQAEQEESAVSADRARVAARSAPVCGNCGTVQAIRALQLNGDASGLGAVAGGVTGAVIGNQMGSGRGNTAMTVIGAAGGALAGNEIEKNMKKRQVYRITVRMDDGSIRTLSQSQPPAVAVGGKVSISDGVLAARS